MRPLHERRCAPWPADRPALIPTDTQALLAQIDGWALTDDGTAIERELRFDDFHRVMAFVNALAWIAHREDHHPDLVVGYGRCTVRFQTHSAGGLTDNDFICAAKVDRLTAD
ncbi:MAG: 4a-hydroxytetrahydrobiopterin dehydratase [Ectothiorhodospiraceae bacterium]|nr:4a-hydroxytetrahydrobiopterin dehydratase [Chromatiales bacterium]MCP5157191.1 4a-hydroxytetrahydrobiopterin dehydratase [Ectothiorhodospiraceae bacterium]